jgi:hypothetical protein
MVTIEYKSCFRVKQSVAKHVVVFMSELVPVVDQNNLAVEVKAPQQRLLAFPFRVGNGVGSLPYTAQLGLPLWFEGIELHLDC